MALVKPRTAAVIVVTVIVAAVFSLVLLPRWQAARAVNSSQPSTNADQSLAKLDEPDPGSEAMWNPKDPSETSEKNVNPRKPVVESVPDASDRSPNLPPLNVEPKAKPREVLNVLKNDNRKIRVESQPKGAKDETPNALKYEKLLKLLRQIHDPQGDDTVDLRNNKPKLSKELEKEALKVLAEEHHQQEGWGSDGRDAPPPRGNSMAAPITSRPDGSGTNDRSNEGNPSNRRESSKARTSQALTTTSSPLTTPPPTPNPAKDLPSMRRGSVVFTPERLPPPANSADIYYSLLTAPAFHNLRFSLQYLTWLQTLDPRQV